jgi:hypothetical protein
MLAHADPLTAAAFQVAAPLHGSCHLAAAFLINLGSDVNCLRSFLFYYKKCASLPLMQLSKRS